MAKKVPWHTVEMAPASVMAMAKQPGRYGHCVYSRLHEGEDVECGNEPTLTLVTWLPDGSFIGTSTCSAGTHRKFAMREHLDGIRVQMARRSGETSAQASLRLFRETRRR